jgi:hypothetical protein
MAPLNDTSKLAFLYIPFLRFSQSKSLLSLSSALTNDVALQIQFLYAFFIHTLDVTCPFIVFLVSQHFIYLLL